MLLLSDQILLLRVLIPTRLPHHINHGLGYPLGSWYKFSSTSLSKLFVDFFYCCANWAEIVLGRSWTEQSFENFRHIFIMFNKFFVYIFPNNLYSIYLQDARFEPGTTRSQQYSTHIGKHYPVSYIKRWWGCWWRSGWCLWGDGGESPRGDDDGFRAGAGRKPPGDPHQLGPAIRVQPGHHHQRCSLKQLFSY